jgi:hypothetical protein
MNKIGNTEALEAYLQLQKQNEGLRQEIRRLQTLYDEYYTAWNKATQGINTLFNWLETRENTKTETVRIKMAETFKYAYMQAQFEDMRTKWAINQKSSTDVPKTATEEKPQ